MLIKRQTANVLNGITSLQHVVQGTKGNYSLESYADNFLQKEIWQLGNATCVPHVHQIVHQ